MGKRLTRFVDMRDVSHGVAYSSTDKKKTDKTRQIIVHRCSWSCTGHLMEGA